MVSLDLLDYIRLLKSSIFFLYFTFFLICAGFGWSQDQNVSVSAEIDAYKAFENHPLQGTITISHDTTAVIDPASFRMNDKPLEVELVKNVPISSSLVISIYQFQLPGGPKGIYTLPRIQVTVGGKSYYSLAAPYEVTGAVAPSNINSLTTANQASLILRASVEGPLPLYPGQRTRLIYRFYFKGDIELVAENLPLLDPKGFVKVGGKKITEFQENDFNVQEVAQEVQAIEAGKYTFESSSIEGYAYQEEPEKRIYLQPKLHSEVPAVTVVVSPFPAEGKPVYFSGATGKFTMRTLLLTPATVIVDDKISLAIEISETTENLANLSTVKVPDLVQAGFKRFFRFSDLPPVAQVNAKIKRFTIDLYPLKTTIKEIPSIPFSYFDPDTVQYHTIQSAPIPLTVQPRQSTETTESLGGSVEKIKTLEFEKKIYPPPALKITGIMLLELSDLTNLPYGTWMIFWIVPFGICFIMAQIFLRRFMKQQRQKVYPKYSLEVFKEAMQTPKSTPVQFQLLAQALLLRLKEEGQISSSEITHEELPSTGITGEVRDLLNTMERYRFAGQSMQGIDFTDKAKHIFEKLASSKP